MTYTAALLKWFVFLIHTKDKYKYKHKKQSRAICWCWPTPLLCSSDLYFCQIQIQIQIQTQIQTKQKIKIKINKKKYTNITCWPPRGTVASLKCPPASPPITRFSCLGINIIINMIIVMMNMNVMIIIHDDGNDDHELICPSPWPEAKEKSFAEQWWSW